MSRKYASLMEPPASSPPATPAFDPAIARSALVGIRTARDHLNEPWLVKASQGHTYAGQALARCIERLNDAAIDLGKELKRLDMAATAADPMHVKGGLE